jgi:type I restriction enzyme, S subunit
MSLNSEINKNRPGYKKTELGWIPEEWKRFRISDFGIVKSGTTPSRQQYNKYYLNGSIPWVKTGDLNNSLIFKTDEKLTKEAISNTLILPEDTVLIAMYGGFKQIGRTGLLKIKATTNQAISGIVNDQSQVQSLFLQYYLNYFFNYWKKFAAGSRKDPNINKSDIENFILYAPDIHEQKKIAEILSCWDKSIEKTENLINAKFRLKKALMQQLLSGKNRFKEFIKSDTLSPKHDSYPSDWAYLHIREVANEISVRCSGQDNIRVLSCTKYDGLVDSLAYFKRKVFSDDTSNYKVVKKGQFAYATNHIEEGSIGLLESVGQGLVSPMYTVFETNKNVFPSFLYKVLKTDKYIHIFKSNTEGSINRRGGLRWREFSNIRIPLPTLEEQKKTAQTIDLAEKEIKLLTKQMEKLKYQKKGLMQKLLTGEIRVK